MPDLREREVERSAVVAREKLVQPLHRLPLLVRAPGDAVLGLGLAEDSENRLLELACLVRVVSVHPVHLVRPERVRVGPGVRAVGLHGVFARAPRVEEGILEIALRNRAVPEGLAHCGVGKNDQGQLLSSPVHGTNLLGWFLLYQIFIKCQYYKIDAS